MVCALSICTQDTTNTVVRDVMVGCQQGRLSINIKTMFRASIGQVLSEYDQGTITPKKCAHNGFCHVCAYIAPITHPKHPQTITKLIILIRKYMTRYGPLKTSKYNSERFIIETQSLISIGCLQIKSTDRPYVFFRMKINFFVIFDS